jgi:DNA polymerase-3 subunit gamma/tau
MYQALYRKYRPQTFDDVVGQNAITQTLKNQLITGKLSHAYLFTGTRGTGKTTCAKILAKAVNCENLVDGNPCGVCAACQGIDSGSVLDVQEIDAASNNGVDNVRAIRDDAIYPPVEVKKRVYIIDEVHMLSMSAFNALLKTIEEPPEHLMFILATTELNKVPATILSRCQRFAFRRPTAEDITGRINYVAYQEGIDLEPEAAELLGRLADGAFRDGLSLLDQCASAVSGKLTVDGVYSTLGLAGRQQTVDLMMAIADRNTTRALQLFAELYGAGKDASALLGELSTLARDLLIVKTAPQSGIGMISSICTGQEVMQLAPRFTAQELLRMVDLLQETTSGFKTSLNPRVDGELCLIHLCQPDLTLDAKDLAARVSRVEEDVTDKLAQLEQKLKSGNFVVSQTAPEPEDLDAPPPWEDDDAPPLPEEPEAQAETPQDGDWLKIRERALPELDPMVRPFLSQLDGRIRGDDLTLTPLNSTIRGMVNRPEVLELLRKKAAVVLGRPMRVHLGEPNGRGISGPDRLQALADQFGNLDNFTIKK